MPNVDSCAPVDQSPSYSIWGDGKAGKEVGSWERSVEGAAKKTDVSDVTPQVKQSKATEYMRNIALAIARRIDSVWDRINPGHQGSAVSIVSSIFRDPTILAPVLSDRLFTDIRATKEELQLLHGFRSLAMTAKLRGDDALAEKLMKKYDEALAKMGGRRDVFSGQLNEIAHMLEAKHRQGPPIEGVDISTIDFQLLAFEHIWANEEYRSIDAIVSDWRCDSSKPYIDDSLSIDDDFWNWNDPSQSIAKEKTLLSGFEYLRGNITEEGMWRLSGSANSKKQNLEKIDKGIAPAFTDVKEATDVLKVLIGATSYDGITPYLNHSLSLEKFKELSEKAEKGGLPLDTINEALKAAFGGDRKKLAMFKQLLVLLKDTSKHADDNKMTVENLVICPLNGLLQRYFRAEAGDAAKNCHLGAFLINNADAILADI